MFCAVDIAVALECYILPIDGNDAVKDIFPRGNLSQYGIAHFDMCHSRKDNAIASVFQEGTHAIPSYTQRGRMSLFNQIPDTFQEDIIRQFDYILVCSLTHESVYLLTFTAW